MGESVLITVFLPSLRGGGAERVMVAVANGLAARGHRVDLVLVAAEGPYMQEVASAVRIVDLQRGRVLSALWPLARYLRKERPTAFLSAMNHVNLVAILAHRLTWCRARLVISERNSLTSLDQGRRGQLFLRLMAALYPKADAVIAVSQAGRAELTSILGLRQSQVSAIPNPVDPTQIEPQAALRPDHPWLQPGQAPVILAAGRLVPQKDYPLLLDAFAQLCDRVEARLVILGEGPLRPALLAQIRRLNLSGRVTLAGFQPNPFGWMAACKVYVLSSRFEGFPNALVQAMACGARVVSTACPTGPSEILVDGRWGLLVPMGDSEALATALEAALTDLDWPDARIRARDFAPDRIIDAYETALLSQR